MAHNLVDTNKLTAVDQAINGFFERSIDYASRIDPSYQQLWQVLYDLIRSGGKRLRPQMTILAYEAFGGQHVDKLIPIAAAQELLHFCLLIHDDVIDRDFIRYGTDNVAGHYKKTYSRYILSADDVTHFANSAAILGGDLMLSGAHQLVALSTLSERDKLTAQGFLSHSVFEVAGGELLDTELSFVPYTNGDALKVARYKTASYSFVAPLLTGATIAGITTKQTEALNTYALSLGTAYQLVDDLLGVFGEKEKTGKSTSSDITEGKRTYLVEQALTSMSDKEKELFESIFGNPDASSEEIEVVKKLFETTGARQATLDAVREYAETARATIDDMDISDRYRQDFEDFITKLTDRTY